MIDVKVPDIGDFKDVPIIEISVKPGDVVKIDDPLLTLESDKASMEVPSPSAGTVKEVLVKVGDRVGKDKLIVRLEGGDVPSAAHAAPAVMHQQEAAEPPPSAAPAAAAPKSGGPAIADFSGAHASPAIRRLARELDIDLNAIKGTGEKGRVTKEDLKASLGAGAKGSSTGAPAGGMGIPEIPAVDFSKFGPVEIKPMVRIKRISGPFLHRAWLNIPHVTHNDDADISEIEKYRKELDDAGKADKKKPYRVSLLPFLMKASVNALKAFPDFNSSLTSEKDALVYKKFYNIGIAVDTPEGLVVPVVKDVDRKGIIEICRELGDISARARDGKLTPAEMQGATFTISSLGGIGGQRLHADRQCARGRNSRCRALQNGAGVEWRKLRAAADAAALPFLRSSRDRWRRGCALRPTSRDSSRRRTAARPLTDRNGRETMTDTIKVPDIGDFKDVPVIEVHVKPGQVIAAEDTLITLESDKATFDVPAPAAGTIGEVKVKIGDKVSAGTVIATFAGAAAASAPAASAPAAASPAASATPSTAKGDLHAEVLVIGAGPGGYSAAFRAADLGKKVVLVDKGPTLGGVCLNVGCIPSKALLHAAKVIDETREMSAHGVSFAAPSVDIDKLRGWKDGIIKKLTGGLSGLAKQRKVTVVTGVAKFASPKSVQVQTSRGRQDNFVRPGDHCLRLRTGDAAFHPARRPARDRFQPARLNSTGCRSGCWCSAEVLSGSKWRRSIMRSASRSRSSN